jgi:hypothetical protein
VWAGRQVEVVFDPRRHQIVMVRNEPGETTRVSLVGEGFRRLAVDGQQEMWMRDRSAAAEQAPVPSATIQAAPKVASLGERGL